MRRPIVIAVVLGIVFAAATFGLVIFSALSSNRYTCEVCISYLGRYECREAIGPTPEEATRTATDNACAFMAAGMTQVVQCTTRTQPQRVDCREN